MSHRGRLLPRNQKRDQLAAGNRKIEVLRWLIRLAYERDLLTPR